MTSDEFRELKQLLLNQAVKLEELELHLRRQDEQMELYRGLLFERYAPDQVKSGRTITPVDMPENLRKLFDT